MKKILTLCDNPLSSSGVARQAMMMIQALLDDGNFEVVSIAAAVEHKNYDPFITEKYGESWKIFPSKGYTDLELLRSLIKTEKPDLLWIMNDPRFFEPIWAIDGEIREKLPIVYYHVWDNYPYPYYNSKYYHSNDAIVTISKLTEDIVEKVAPKVKRYHLPHSVDTDVYRPVPFEEVEYFLEANKIRHKGKKIFFWNNRNAGRKQPASLLWWFKELLDEVGHNKAMLIMHTDPKDKHGPNLIENLERLNLTNGQVFISNAKVPDRMLATFYNIADCTINIADAEGFGLSSLESMACGTPVISTMTGGLQDQIFDGENWFGIGIEPSSRAIVGSQTIPYIYEDRINSEDFKKACKRIINTPKKDLNDWGRKCRDNVIRNFNFKKYKSSWVSIVDEVCELNGSWDTRREHKSWSLIPL